MRKKGSTVASTVKFACYWRNGLNNDFFIKWARFYKMYQYYLIKNNSLKNLILENVRIVDKTALLSSS